MRYMLIWTQWEWIFRWKFLLFFFFSFSWFSLSLLLLPCSRLFLLFSSSLISNLFCCVDAINAFASANEMEIFIFSFYFYFGEYFGIRSVYGWWMWSNTEQVKCTNSAMDKARMLSVPFKVFLASLFALSLTV